MKTTNKEILYDEWKKMWQSTITKLNDMTKYRGFNDIDKTRAKKYKRELMKDMENLMMYSGNEEEHYDKEAAKEFFDEVNNFIDKALSEYFKEQKENQKIFAKHLILAKRAKRCGLMKTTCKKFP